MSGTVVYAAFENGDLTELETVRNSYHGAMHVWRTLAAWVQTTVADLAWRGDGSDEDDLDAPFNIDRQPLTGPEVGVGERGGRLA